MPFGSIAGHQRILTLLSRSIARGTLPPALLLTGPDGIGKKRAALSIAEALNCLTPKTGDFDIDGCGACVACRRISRGIHADVIVIEPGDMGSIKIEQVRDVIDRAAYRPFEGRRRAVIIDHADAMVPAAQNALLKTLEEPPSASCFALVSSSPDALLPTVRSRCSHLRFAPLSSAEVAGVLMREHEYAEEDARAAAAEADGSVGNALAAGSLDLVEARNVARRVLEGSAHTGDPGRRIDLARDMAPTKATRVGERDHLAVILRMMASLVRDVSILAMGGDARTLANPDLQRELEPLTRAFGPDRAMRAFAAVDRALAELERNVSPKVLADWLVLQL